MAFTLDPVFVFLRDNSAALFVFVACFLVCSFLISAYSFLISAFHAHPLPPGPWPVPVLGNLLQLSRDVHLDFIRLGAKYGPVFRVQFASQSATVLNDYSVIREALTKQATIFVNRHHEEFGRIIFQDTGIVMTDGKLWRDHRQFALHVLKDYGMGKSSVEEKIQEECRELMAALDTLAGKPVALKSLMCRAVCNIIHSLEFGYRRSYDDPQYNEVLTWMDSLTQLDPALYLFPVLRSLPFIPRLLGFDRLKQHVRFLDQFLDARIEEHKARLNVEDPQDFTDAFLVEQQKRCNEESSTFTDKQLRGVLRDLFLAGTDTSSNTLRWALLLAAKFPHIQEKVKQEIWSNIGPEGMISMQDKRKLPYTEAFIMETQRFATILPVGVGLNGNQDTELRGYRIPAHTLVYTNLYNVLRNADNFPEPDTFKPERFIGEDGKVLRPEQLIPFSMGRRSCLGEALAKTELFIFLGTLLQSFKFSFPVGEEVQSLKGVSAFVLHPPVHRLVITRHVE